MRGGYRPGSGRKKGKPKVIHGVTLKVAPEARRAWNALCDGTGMSGPQLFGLLVNQLANDPQALDDLVRLQSKGGDHS